MPDKQVVDVAIIGAGSAGMRAYREAVKVTDSVLVIEGGAWGTTCARVGCMPSKLLIAAAEVAIQHRYSQPFGVHYPAPRIDGQEVMARVRRERDRFVGFVTETVAAWPNRHRLQGWARFLEDNVLMVGEQLIEAKCIVIATGSSAKVIDSLQIFKERLLTNDDVFSWQDLPKSVAVFGAGVIGLELGQALSHLGVEVVLFGRDQLVGPLSDPEVMRVARETLQADFAFYPHAEIIEQRLLDDQAEIQWRYQGELKTQTFDCVLAATGRVANVHGLGLENTSLPLDAHGVPLWDSGTCRIADSSVFLAGDASNCLPLLHEAIDEGTVAGYNAAHYPDIRRFSKSSPLSVVFCQPQIIMVGQSYNALLTSGQPFAIGQLDWQDQGRARVMSVNRGLLRVYGDKDSGRFLGAEMIGPSAEHIAHLLAWCHQMRLTVTEMLQMPYYHPVLEEGLRTALRDLNHQLQRGPQSPPRCLDCGVGA